MRRVVFSALVFIASLQAQTDWPAYGNDPGAARYSPLTQIDATNVARLRPAWTFHTGKPGSEAIPVVINGTLYVNAANGIFALNPESGAELWHYDASKVSLRGLAFWPGDPKTHPRVFSGIGSTLAGIDAVTGKPAPGFGTEGFVDLRQGVTDDPKAIMSLQSPPSLYKDLVITGSMPNEGKPSLGAYGDIRAWDARSGKLVWSFHTVPRTGEAGVETWAAESWKNRSGTNAWGFLTIDAARGIVYVPLGSPTSDFYGADRHGEGLYGNSLVALDAATGKLLWYRQLVHHDLWDYDLAAPPVLFDSHRDGQTIPAVGQITKMGLAFFFNRVTGEPLFGLEERPVPQSKVPGEASWPTQPFPVKPPPLAKNTFRKEDIYSLTPDHAAYCQELYTKNRLFTQGPYTPLPLEDNALLFPSTIGGGNWGGFSFDPALGYLFTNVNNVGQWGHMEKKTDAKTGEETYVRTSALGTYARFWNPATRIPCTNPPFGQLVAVNANTGDIAWRAPLGRIPELEAQGVTGTGSMNLGGSIATAGGIVFIAATNDALFRAFESKSGKLLWEHPIAANGHTSPITYLGKDKKQYVVITAGGGGGFFGGTPSDTVMAFALADTATPLPAITTLPLPKTPTTIVAQAASLPPSPERDLLHRTCGGPCHDIKTVTTRRMSATEWSAIVDNMVNRGAVASPGEVKTIGAYLAKQLGR
ncbi:MAG: pyrroloquinoline quinone-dependent dehydrogenase [Bryobacteraceae bacterium]